MCQIIDIAPKDTFIQCKFAVITTFGISKPIVFALYLLFANITY